jgi:ribosomal-protein-alanine N-acetyltransferase
MWPFSRPAAAPVIRLFTPARAAACAAIHAGAFHRGWSAQEIAALGMEPSVLAHVALDSTQTSVLGFSLARCAGQEAEILTIVVDAARRGRGLGRLLLQTQLDALALQGVREVFLEVEADNVAALTLYKRLGFSQVGERKAYYARPGQAPATALILRREQA